MQNIQDIAHAVEVEKRQSDPLVTILINTYNYGRFLGRAINSALEQTYPASLTEIIVVDDGSTDETQEVVGRYDPQRVRYLRKENGGQASAVNAGFREARGQIICLLDGDDYFFPEKVERVVQAFQADPELGFVYNDLVVVDNDCKPIPAKPVDMAGDVKDLTLLGYPPTSPTSTMSVRRTAVEGIHIPEIAAVGADYYLCSVLFLRTRSVKLTGHLTGYVQHSSNYYLANKNGRTIAKLIDYHAAVRNACETALGPKFVTYLEPHFYTMRGEPVPRRLKKLRLAFQESYQIAEANVDGGVKLQALSRLAANLVLPTKIRTLLRAKGAGRLTWLWSRRLRSTHQRLSRAGSRAPRT